MPSNNFKSAVKLAGSGKRVPAMDLIKNDPEMAAVISKLIAPKDPAQFDNSGTRKISNPDTFSFRNIADKLKDNVRDAEIIMQLLPDMELWAQILISSILSPKDMMTVELNYRPPADLFSSDVANALIQEIKTHFEQVYKIKPLLSDILRAVLFETGSYPIAVIPENSLDELINGTPKITMESLKTHIGADGEIAPLGLLGPGLNKSDEVAKTQRSSKTGISLETLGLVKSYPMGIDETQVVIPGMGETYLTVTDNPNLLRVPQINERLRRQHISDVLGVRSMESIHKVTDREVTGMIYKHKQPGYKHFVSLKTDSQLYRRSVGEPLIMRMASEAVIPVHIPGAPDKHVAFFVLIDADGNPLSRASADDQYRMLGNRLNSGSMQRFPSAMIEKVNSMVGGENNFDPNNRMHVDYSVKAYSELIEADLMARLKSGGIGKGVSISGSQEVYRLMLSRMLQKQNTQLLFIPVELMTYFALRYDENGIGRSLIDDMKVLLSMRIMMMFSNVMSAVKNSIGRTAVRLKLDPDDPDPQKTIEISQHEIIRSRMQAFPVGMSNPVDMVDWLQRASFEFVYEGHPKLPDVSVDFSEKASSYAKPDTDLEEQLRKNSIMAAGLNPETVDAGFGAEFATSVVANNILLSKRVIQIQEKITPQIIEHLRKVIVSSQPLSDGIKTILRDNLEKIKSRLTEEFTQNEDSVIIDRVFHDFVYGFEVSLPAPNSVTLENQKEALDKYIESLDVALDSQISDKFITEATAGNISGDVSLYREVARAYFIRQWISDNGMLPELAALTSTNEDGSPMVNFFEEQRAHIEALTKAMTNLSVKLHDGIQQNNQLLENKGIDAEGIEGTTSDSSSSSSSSGGDDFGGGDFDFGDMGGMDDMGGGDDLATNEDSTEDTAEKDESEQKPDEEEKPGSDTAE